MSSRAASSGRSSSVTGVAQQLATFNVGDSFGEMSLIDKQPRSASISALSDGELLEFTKES